MPPWSNFVERELVPDEKSSRSATDGLGARAHGAASTGGGDERCIRKSVNGSGDNCRSAENEEEEEEGRGL